MSNSINKHRFKIETNSADQRILIVGDDYRSFVYEPVPFDAFDAILFETEDTAVLKRQILSIVRVESSPNYSFKAFFINPAINNKSALIYADGICSGIEAQDLIRETRRIKERFVALRFKVFDRDSNFWTPERRIFHVVRTHLIRSDKFPDWEVARQSALGYALPRFEMLMKYKIATVKEVMQCLEKLCTQHKLLETGELRAVLNICPHCYENKMIWHETCPKCGTIDIEEVHMIHHFRCANISSEESYLKDGKLICPKCKHELKHIGVDYDRPASMYLCKENNIHFSTPVIKALCTNCEKTSELVELLRRKIHQLSYTNLGISMFAQNDHVHDSDDIPKLSTIHSYNSFVSAIRVRVNIARNNGNLYPVVFRLRVTPEDNYDMINLSVINRIYKLHPNAVISYKNGAFYLLQSFTHKLTKEIIDEILPLKEFNRKNPGYKFDGNYIELDINRDIDSIIASL